MKAAELLTATHSDISHQYGCAATMTVATFVVHGIYHRARRHWRSDLPTSGKIELYTIEPYPGVDATSMTEAGWLASTMSESFLRYVDKFAPSAVDSIAIDAIAGLFWQRSNISSALEADQAARFGAVELY